MMVNKEIVEAEITITATNTNTHRMKIMMIITRKNLPSTVNTISVSIREMISMPKMSVTENDA